MRLWHGASAEVQRGDELSHVGGRPLLPVGASIPICSVTGTEMTFFFQVHLPRSVDFGGSVVSIFAVTDHAEDAAYLPDLPAVLRNAALDEGFFAGEPKFYRVFCFDPAGAARVPACREPVAFRTLRVGDRPERDCVAFGRIGGSPDWLLDDEAPRSFGGRTAGIEFLFQTDLDYAFATSADAPRQREIDFSGAGVLLKDCSSDHYQLFVGNALYVFGLRDGDARHIYIVPQS